MRALTAKGRRWGRPNNPIGGRRMAYSSERMAKRYPLGGCERSADASILNRATTGQTIHIPSHGRERDTMTGADLRACTMTQYVRGQVFIMTRQARAAHGQGMVD